MLISTFQQVKKSLKILCRILHFLISTSAHTFLTDLKYRSIVNEVIDSFYKQCALRKVGIKSWESALAPSLEQTIYGFALSEPRNLFIFLLRRLHFSRKFCGLMRCKWWKKQKNTPKFPGTFSFAEYSVRQTKFYGNDWSYVIQQACGKNFNPAYDNRQLVLISIIKYLNFTKSPRVSNRLSSLNEPKNSQHGLVFHQQNPWNKHCLCFFILLWIFKLLGQLAHHFVVILNRNSNPSITWWQWRDHFITLPQLRWNTLPAHLRTPLAQFHKRL